MTPGGKEQGARGKGRKKPEPMTGLAAAARARGLTLEQRVAAFERWRESYNPLRGLTIRRAVSLLEQYPRGEMADLQWTFAFVEQTDPDMLALIELRIGRLLEMDWNVLVPEEEGAGGKGQGADRKLAEEQQAFLRERIDAIDNFYDAVEHLAMAAFRGFAHCEKWYGDDGFVSHLECVDQWNAVRDGSVGPWRYNPQARSTNYFALGAEADMPPEQFIFRQVRRFIDRIGLVKFVRSSIAEKDWDAYDEIYGIPGGVLIGPPNVPPGKEAEYETEARKISEGGSGFMPHGSDWKPNTAARGTQPFKERLDHLTEKLVLAGTGGKLTMLTDATGLGSGASGQHGEVFDSIASAEARRISEVINRQLVVELLEMQFPGRPQLAYFALAANEETDTGAIVGHVVQLASVGYKVPAAQVAEKTGYAVEAAPTAPAPTDRTDPTNPARRVIANRAGAAAEMAQRELFERRAADLLTDAERTALAPLLERFAAIEQASEAELPALFEQLQADLPDLYARVLRDDALVDAWEKVLAPAFFEGLSRGTKGGRK